MFDWDYFRKAMLRLGVPSTLIGIGGGILARQGLVPAPVVAIAVTMAVFVLVIDMRDGKDDE